MKHENTQINEILEKSLENAEKLENKLAAMEAAAQDFDQNSIKKNYQNGRKSGKIQSLDFYW